MKMFIDYNSNKELRNVTFLIENPKEINDYLDVILLDKDLNKSMSDLLDTSKRIISYIDNLIEKAEKYNNNNSSIILLNNVNKVSISSGSKIYLGKDGRLRGLETRKDNINSIEDGVIIKNYKIKSTLSTILKGIKEIQSSKCIKYFEWELGSGLEKLLVALRNRIEDNGFILVDDLIIKRLWNFKDRFDRMNIIIQREFLNHYRGKDIIIIKSCSTYVEEDFNYSQLILNGYTNKHPSFYENITGFIFQLIARDSTKLLGCYEGREIYKINKFKNKK